jgi:hypothetical protein
LPKIKLDNNAPVDILGAHFEGVDSMKALLMAAIVLALSGCSDSQKAARALHSAGYSEINAGGYSFFGCGKEDTYSTMFTAKGPTGVQVSGVVCSGIFKSSTIRIND